MVHTKQSLHKRGLRFSMQNNLERGKKFSIMFESITKDFTLLRAGPRKLSLNSFVLRTFYLHFKDFEFIFYELLHSDRIEKIRYQESL